MKQNNALSWSFLLMATCLFGVGLGLSLGYAIFSPHGGATPANQVAQTPPETAPPAPEATTTPPVELKAEPAPATEETKPAAPAVTTIASETKPAGGETVGYWAGRHLFIALNGQWLADTTKELLKEVRPGGVVLQDANLGSRAQTFALVKDIKAATGLGDGLGDLPLIAVQQEVGPYNLLGLENAPTAQALGENGDPELARKLGQDYGAACVGRGIAIAFAPMLDVYEPGAINPGYAVRSFGTEHTLVARMGLAMADGLRQGGVLPVVKNFPGYGAATYGSDGLLVALNKDPAGLGKLLYPFDQAVRRGVPGMLVAHVAVPALDPEDPRRPAALSPVLVTELLRERWGYDGVIVADDVALNSMTRTMGAEQATVQALAAGCDAVLMLDPDPVKIRAVTAAIAAAVEKGTLSKDKLQQSAARLTRWQEAIGNLNAVTPPTASKIAESLPPPAPSPMPNPTPIETTAPPALEINAHTAEPKPAPTEPGKTEPAPAAPEDTRSLIEHTVGAGDTLDKIAQAYSVSVDDLKKWNALSTDAVAVGSRLKVYLAEGGGAPESTPSAPKPVAPKEMPKAEPAPAEETPPAPVGAGGKAVYTVVEGDTLATIAAKFKVAAADIKTWNGLDTDAPAAGTVLTIFLGGPAESTAAPEPEKNAPDPAEAVTKPEEAAPAPAETKAPEPAPAVEVPADLVTEEYTVQSGDTVSKIARDYKTTRELILTLNGLKDANQIVVGQKLKVPKAPT